MECSYYLPDQKAHKQNRIKQSHDLLRLTEVGELDEDEVHDLLHGVDHEEPSQDQDLCHRKPGVWETARLDRRRGDLNMIFV